MKKDKEKIDASFKKLAETVASSLKNSHLTPQIERNSDINSQIIASVKEKESRQIEAQKQAFKEAIIETRNNSSKDVILKVLEILDCELGLVPKSENLLEIKPFTFHKAIVSFEETGKVLKKLEGDTSLIKIIQTGSMLTSRDNKNWLIEINDKQSFIDFYEQAKSANEPVKEGKNNKAVLEITFNKARGEVLLNEIFVLSTPQVGKDTHKLIEILIQNPNKEISVGDGKDIKIAADIHATIRDLGFTGILKTLFIDGRFNKQNEGTIKLFNPVTSDRIAKYSSEKIKLKSIIDKS